MKGESKKKRFIRVVEKRVQNAVDSIRKISQCSNKRMYEWDEDQLNTIWSALESEIKKCRESFKSDHNQIFKLS
ncbi:MAG: hypothetical protein PVI26_11170 [Chitinispirillia bacterium]|jgi:hypothetical protein